VNGSKRLRAREAGNAVVQSSAVVESHAEEGGE
jgi:hypothetical protein